MIRLLCVGKMKDKALQSLVSEYAKRISAFTKIEVLEVKDEPNTHAERDAEAVRIKDSEAERVLAKLRDQDLVVLLDLGGKMWDSEQFAKLIAGSLGPGAALLRRSDLRWKLSDLTFTHLLTRVLILEQIYRGFMILHGRTYHK